MQWGALALVANAVSQCSGGRTTADESPGLPWYAALSTFHFPHVSAADVDGSALLATVNSSAADYVLMEFYAPWCPQCQHFAPDYERVALALQRLGSSVNATKGVAGQHRVLSGTVDCVQYESACKAWNIDGYPTMLWGSKSDWLANDVRKLKDIDTDRTAEAVAGWINNELKIDMGVEKVTRREIMQLFGDLKAQTSALAGGPVVLTKSPTLARVDMLDVQAATALFLHNALNEIQASVEDEGPGASTTADRQRAFLDLLGLLARTYPEKQGQHGSCRSSLKEFQTQLRANVTDPSAVSNELWDPDVVERKWKFCGAEWESFGQRGWGSCRGTWPGKRGFTCGLWSLFHSIASGSDDTNAAEDLQVVRSAISHFFECVECRDHFATIPVSAKDTKSKHAVQLWWWRTHNAVNLRVKGLEEQFEDGDPAFRKVQWPTQELCPKCKYQQDSSLAHIASFQKVRAHESSLTRKRRKLLQDWDPEQVLTFLDQYYRP